MEEVKRGQQEEEEMEGVGGVGGGGGYNVCVGACVPACVRERERGGEAERIRGGGT